MKKFFKFGFYGLGTFLLFFSTIIIGVNFVKDSGLFDKSVIHVMKQEQQKQSTTSTAKQTKNDVVTPAPKEEVQKEPAIKSTEATPKKLAIEVINCTDKTGLAETVRSMLEAKGYEVSAGNHLDSSKGTSIIAIRKENIKGDEISKMLKIPTIKEEYQPDSRYDITILLGKDFAP